MTPGVTLPFYGLTPVTVHMSFSLPQGNLKKKITRCTAPGNPPCECIFSSCEQRAEVAPGQDQSCACSLSILGINFTMKSSKKPQKYFNMIKIHSLQQLMSKLKDFRSIRSDQMTMNLPLGNVAPGQQIIM